jgi:tRNA threonylcarbamoyladenosine biosynthesis protein TsaB
LQIDDCRFIVGFHIQSALDESSAICNLKSAFPVLLLSLDTSSAAGSAAVVRDGRIVVERAGDGARTHAERLPRDLMDVLDAARCSLEEIDGFAVITGPGSFTGLRVGIATVQGLAFARRRPVYPVTAFEAYRRHAGGAHATAVWIDAHRGEVFATLFDAGGGVLEPPSSRPPAHTLDAWQAALEGLTRVHFSGDGAVRYRDTIVERVGEAAAVDEHVPLLAGVAGQIASRDPARAVSPHAVVPQYVRRPDAELARDRRKFD